MRVNFVFLEPINIYSYRRPNCNIPAITGLFEVEPEGKEPRLCYELTYEDGFIDYVPKSDVDAGSHRFVVK